MRKDSVNTPILKNKYLSKVFSFTINTLKKPIVANANYLLGTYVVYAISGFGFWAIISKLHSPETVGLTSTIISSVGLVSGLAIVGLDFCILRFLPESDSPKVLLNSIYLFCSLSSLIMAGIYLLGIRWWAPKLGFLTNNIYLIFGFIIFVVIMTMGALLFSTFLARRITVYIFVNAIVVNVLRLSLATLSKNWGTMIIILAVALCYLIGATVCFFYFLPRVEPEYHFRFQLNKLLLKKIFPYSFGNYLSDTLEQNIQTILLLIVLDLLGPASSGYTSIAWSIGTIILSPGIAWAGSAFTESNNKPQNAKSILIKSSAPAVGLTIITGLILGGGAPLWLSFFGKVYSQEATTLLRVLAIAAPFTIITYFFFNYLRVIKNIRLLLLLDALQISLIVGISHLLVPQFGIVMIGVSILLVNAFIALPVVITAALYIKNKSYK